MKQLLTASRRCYQTAVSELHLSLAFKWDYCVKRGSLREQHWDSHFSLHSLSHQFWLLWNFFFPAECLIASWLYDLPDDMLWCVHYQFWNRNICFLNISFWNINSWHLCHLHFQTWWLWCIWIILLVVPCCYSDAYNCMLLFPEVKNRPTSMI